MTHTTNTSTAESAMTYSMLARDCEHLAEVARKMDAIASEREGFRDDPEFQRVRADFKAAWNRVHSLDIAI